MTGWYGRAAPGAGGALAATSGGAAGAVGLV